VVKDIAAGAGLRHAVRQARANTPDTVMSRLSQICQDEVFGPVVTVSTFRTEEEEAIALANGTEYGLGGGLWTTDLSRAHRVAAAMRSGMI